MHQLISFLKTFLFPDLPMEFAGVYIPEEKKKEDEPIISTVMLKSIFKSVTKLVKSIISPPKPEKAPPPPPPPKISDLPSSKAKREMPVPDDKTLEQQAKVAYQRKYGGRGRKGSILTSNNKDNFKEDNVEFNQVSYR